MIEINQNKSKKPVTNKSKGGARLGAGRKKGSLTKRTRDIAEVAAAKGISPLEVMMNTMMEIYKEAIDCGGRDSNQHHDYSDKVNKHDDGHDSVSTDNRIKLLNMAATIARYAAPYLHPRLSAIEHTGKDGAPLQGGVLVVPGVMSMDEWEEAAKIKS